MSESQERMMAVVEPDDVDGVPGDLRQVGRRGRRHRRGHRHRPPRRSTGTASASSTYPRGRSPTTARPTTARSPGPTGRTRCRPTAPRRCRARRPATSCATPLLRLVASPEPLRQVVDHRPVRPLRPRQHRARPARATAAWCASTRRPTSASRSRPTATAASPSSTRTPARSSRWPRPTATSRPAAPRPLAVTDCLNFGSPEDPDVMWQFAEACRGLKDACLELGIPVTGGNVSLYNQTGDDRDPARRRSSAVLGVIDDVTRRTPSGFAADGEHVFLLGETREELVRLRVGARRPRPPRRPAAAGRPRRRAGARSRCSSRPPASASSRAHDLSDGGLAQALAEACMRHGVGVTVDGLEQVGVAAEGDPLDRSPRSSPSRVRALSSPSPPAAQPSSRRCSATCRTPASASRADATSTSSATSPCRWPSSGRRTSSRCRRSSGADLDQGSASPPLPGLGRWRALHSALLEGFCPGDQSRQRVTLTHPGGEVGAGDLAPQRLDRQR